MSLLAVFFGLAVGNFVYAYIKGDYERAVDRTLFQGIALIVVAFLV